MSASAPLPQPQKVTVAALTAFIIASLFYLYQYVIRTAPGTLSCAANASGGGCALATAAAHNAMTAQRPLTHIFRMTCSWTVVRRRADRGTPRRHHGFLIA